MNQNIEPWFFDGEPFTETPENMAGFCYLIEDKETGRKYIGKKFFWGKRKGKKVESDWKNYFSSNDDIKFFAKTDKARFKRTILSLHEKERDVNYYEVKFLFMFGVLEEFFEDGTPVFYNNNISGKYFKHLVHGAAERSKLSTTPLDASTTHPGNSERLG